MNFTINTLKKVKVVVIKMNENKTNINWYPGHMKKTKDEIRSKLPLIDLVLEVIDARMPFSSKIKDLDELIGNKKRILVVTKYDLCDTKKTEEWLNDYEKQGYLIARCELLTGKGIKELLHLCETIFQEENEKRKQKGMKERSIRALIVGVPNVGKSTLINQLVGKKAVNVGNRPGVTKNVGWIRIHQKIELLDTPGILWPKLEDQEGAHILAIFSSIKEEILDKEELAIFAISLLEKQYPKAYYARYDLKENMELVEQLEQIGKKRGALMRGGVVDYEKVYGILLQDIKNNAFGPITLDIRGKER